MAVLPTLVESNSPYAIPTSLAFDEKLQQFPLLLKPRAGSGSQGIAIVKDREALEKHLVDIGPKMMIQPVIGTSEEEYTASAFFDLKSQLCASITLKRRLSKAGFTDRAETVEVDNIENVLVHLGGIFKPVGPTNFQFRVDHGQLKLLEINPRISSATSIRTAFGYNESAMSVEFFLRNISPTQPILKRGCAIRYSEDIIYYDSTDF
jgi:carbamoyl-phosphate synthase large subunit